MNYPEKTREILDLARQLIRIPSVTAARKSVFKKFTGRGRCYLIT